MMTSARQPDDVLTAPAPTDEERTFLGHPIGLTILFLTEMWERFGFYGMRSILVYYMMKSLMFPQAKASNLYGWYLALVYMTPVIGGWLADRFIGYKRAILIGGSVLAAGYFMLGLGRRELFFPALAILILGNGAFKANISTLVGKLYKSGDPRRDRGFGIFYVGINVGAALSPLVCATLADKYGYHWGFAAAGVGMIIGIVTFLAGQPLLRGVNMGAAGNSEAPTVGPQQGQVAPNEDRSTEGGRILALVIICFFVIFFFAAYEQGGNTLALWADDNTDRHLGNFLVPAGWFQSVNPIFIFAMTPVLNIIWERLSKRGKEPSSATKMTIGLFFLGLSFIVMRVAAQAGGSETARVNMMWLVFAYWVQTIGELCLSPIGLSLVTKLAPARLGGMLMGVFFFAIFAGNWLSGKIGALYSRYDHATFFTIFVFSSLVAAAAMFFLLRPLKKLMAGAA